MDRYRNLRTSSGRASARYALSRRANRLLYPRGLALLSDHFYQPLPSRRALEDNPRLEIAAVTATLDVQADLVASLLRDHQTAFEAATPAFGYRRAAAQLPAGDAELLFAMVRHHRPRRVVEIGSGSSSAVIAAALDRNARCDEIPSQFISIDPYAVPVLHQQPDPLVAFDHLPMPLQEANPTLWKTLSSGDILFVDSSHVFKRGSDVEYEFLELYPTLAPGVLVHIHDIFFPHDYPLRWNLDRSQFWNEQYHLATVLQNSTRYEVVAGLAAVHDRHPALLASLIQPFRDGHVPGSIWLRVSSLPRR